MQDFHLKAANEHELYQALLGADLVEFNDEVSQYVPKGIALDIIGAIYKPTGNMISTTEGLQIPEMSAVDGCHANIRGALTEEQQAVLPLISAPATPYRVWA
jgi:hypothetical protein